MNRRSFLLMGAAAAASTLVTLPAHAESTFLNGELNTHTGTFDWTRGGGDPLQRPWRTDGFRQSLAIARLNLSGATQAGLRATLLREPFARVSLRSLYEGKVAGDIMVSGNGWVALRPRVLTSRWGHNKVMASWWSWTNEENGERWEIIVPDVCSNLILTRLGNAVPCVCDPHKDACS